MPELIFCKKCVMDGSASEIVLDSDGVCNFCRTAEKELSLAESEKHNLMKVIERIKADGVGRKYDCLIGLSGGVDSSMALHYAVKLGLRPLAYSMDNGWNDPKADENIMRLTNDTTGLNVPFFRYVIDIPKFKELQGAFIKAGLINIEIPTDHVLMATAYELAASYGIKWIISGGNVATESVMPRSWSYPARDLTHIKDVYKKMTGRKLRGLPVCGLLKWNWNKWVRGVKTLYLLDYFDYNRENAIALLEKSYGYKPYGEKHCESTFTSWFQNFYLYTKFGIDKRKAHYSSLINSGQMTRGEAKELLKTPPVYPQLGLEKKVLTYPKREHEDFKTDDWVFRFLGKIIKKLKYENPRRFRYLGS